MVWLLYVPLWAATALLSRLALAVGPVVRCEPCDSRALEACKPLAPECPEPVREPGCGCCLTCALPEGRPCGVYTERCGAGLSCRPPGDEPKPLQALLDGKGLCTNVSADAAAGGGGGAGSSGGSSGGGGNKLRDLLLLRGSPGPGKPAEGARAVAGEASRARRTFPEPAWPRAGFGQLGLPPPGGGNALESGDLVRLGESGSRDSAEGRCRRRRPSKAAIFSPGGWLSGVWRGSPEISRPH